jgi:hopanoid C-3 methylase
MRVLFARPQPSPETIGLQHLMIVEPLELEILATLIGQNHNVFIVDMILEKADFRSFIEDFHPDIICLTGYITHIPVIINYCIEAKRINPIIITVVGGVQVEKYPDDINHTAIDYRVVRNATHSFPLLIDFLAGKSQFPHGILKTDEYLNEANLPDYDFFTPLPDRSLTSKYRHRYFYVFHNKVALIKTSFGCPYRCKFCFCRKITGEKYYVRPLEDVINELNSINENEIYIVDDDFLVSVKRIKEFINLLRERNIRKRYLVYGRADFIADNPELIKEFRDVGLRTVIVGLESFDDIELASFNKQSDSSTNRRAMNVLNKYKVDCYAAVIISPSWNSEDFRKAGDIMIDLGIKFVNLQPLTPLKGTGIIADEKDLVIDRENYACWDLAHVTIRPLNMELADFYQNILNLYLRIIFYPKHLISMLKYPLHMQFRMSKGIYRVMKQYKSKIMEVSEHA